jgi:large subunit ribosomal protein L16
MALMPKRTVYRSSHRGRFKGKATRGGEVSFGDYGLQALEPALLTGVQIEAARIAINRMMKRRGKIWIRAFPDKPVTKRPPETRMGKGKGNPDRWVCVVLPGKVIFEIEGVGISVAKEAFRRASAKLPFRTKLKERDA